MNRRMLMPLIMGLGGLAILLSLGIWQVQRLAWKEGIIAQIEAMILNPPVPLDQAIAAGAEKYTPVTMSGDIAGPEVHVLVSRRQIGAGYLVITAFETSDGRRVLLDRGFIRNEAKDAPRPPRALALDGNIHIPDDRTSSTPPNDEAHNIWFARDIADMARVLGTEPILVVARSDTGDSVEPMPVTAEGVANDHLEYAMTWFLLALVWAGMTAYLLWRIRARTV
ncbi:MAG: SURF1 family protein [Paracoccaceae bacterium]